MNRPSSTSIAVATLGGLVHVTVVFVLFIRFDYPILESTAAIVYNAIAAFTFGFVPVLIAAHTGLLVPVSGFTALLVGVTGAELASPAPEWGTMGEYTTVDGPIYVAQYSSSWPAWIALLLVAGLAEFAIRRGYRLGDRRLRNLPPLPLSDRGRTRLVASGSICFGLGTVLLAGVSSGLDPTETVVVFGLATAAAGVVLATLLARGLVVPLTIFALWTPNVLYTEAFRSTDSGLHLLLFGALAVVCAVCWKLEEVIRTRYRGWDGGRFAGRTDVS